jgi:excisionase family DNA binding protein
MQEEQRADFLSSGDVARLASVSVETVRAWERRGKLASARTAGGIRLFARIDVERFLAAREAAR